MIMSGNKSPAPKPIHERPIARLFHTPLRMAANALDSKDAGPRQKKLATFLGELAQRVRSPGLRGEP